MENLYIKDPIKAQKKGLEESSKLILLYGNCYGGIIWLNIFNFVFGTMTVSLLACTAYVAGVTDFGTFAESIHFILLCGNGLFCSFCARLNKNCYEKLFRIAGSGFYDYGPTFDADTFNNFVNKTRIFIKLKKQTKCKLFALFIICIFALTAIRPLFEWINGKFEENLILTLENNNGIVYILPASLWFPFVSDPWLQIISATVYEYYAMFNLCGVISCLLIPLITFSEELHNEFKILEKSLILFDERAKALYKLRYGVEPVIKRERIHWRLEQCIRDCFKDSVKHHLILTEFFYGLRQIQYVPLFTSIFAVTGELCLSGVLFADESVKLTVKANFFCILISELLYTYILCSYAQFVQDGSILPVEAIYNSEWYPYSEIIKKYVLIIQPCCQPMKLSALGFISVSLDTFTDVCRSAYSYFSLLQVLKE